MNTSEKRCCGLDVHKETIFAAINANGKAGEVREFSSLTCQIKALSEWLKENEVRDVAMESTGIYWIPEWNILEDAGFRLTMPGTDEQSAMQLIAERGADMNAFETSNKLSNWAGLCPRNDESAGKIKSKATTKGNKYLRRIIVQVAWAASRTKSSSYYNKYNQMAIRKGRRKALVAVARKQLTVVWNILKYNQPYDIGKQPVVTAEQILAKRKYYQKELDKLNLIAMPTAQ